MKWHAGEDGKILYINILPEYVGSLQNNSGALLSRGLRGMVIKDQQVSLLIANPRGLINSATFSSETHNPNYFGTSDIEKFRQDVRLPLLDQQRSLNQNLVRIFDAEPIESGKTHAAEALLMEYIKNYSNHAPIWIEASLVKNFSNSTYASSLLKSFARLSVSSTLPQSASMISAGLHHYDVEVREAAVYAIELWNDPVYIPVLTSSLQREKVAWLQSYIEGVIEDLRAI